MPAIINTNILSLNAQRNLNGSQNALATSLQRLSSGLRINSAKDDAAGLAISERFTSQIRGLNQATRNANDAISMSQTAEGDLTQISNNLQRIRELAVQSANASNSASDRAALQKEASQLISEIDRVAQNSSFNGVKLLDGSFTNQKFQVGADAGQTISISEIGNARTSALKGTVYSATVTGTAVTAALTAGDLSINGTAIGASVAGAGAGQTADSAYAIAAAINAAGVSDVTATANATTVAGAAPTAFTATTDDIAAGDLKINGVDVGAITAGGSAAAQGTAVANAINAITAQTGVTAAADSTTGAVTLTAADGRNIVVAQAGTATTARTGLTAATTRSTVSLALDSATVDKVTIAGNAPAKAGLSAGETAATALDATIAALDVSSVSGANKAIVAAQSALDTVNNMRADLGAYQNRFSSVVSSLQTTSENLTASRSRIMDTDFAQETAAMTRAQILQQAGTAMLAQANALPNNVLSLLRG